MKTILKLLIFCTFMLLMAGACNPQSNQPQQATSGGVIHYVVNGDTVDYLVTNEQFTTTPIGCQGIFMTTKDPSTASRSLMLRITTDTLVLNHDYCTGQLSCANNPVLRLYVTHGFKTYNAMLYDAVDWKFTSYSGGNLSGTFSGVFRIYDNPMDSIVVSDGTFSDIPYNVSL